MVKRETINILNIAFENNQIQLIPQNLQKLLEHIQTSYPEAAKFQKFIEEFWYGFFTQNFKDKKHKLTKQEEETVNQLLQTIINDTDSIKQMIEKKGQVRSLAYKFVRQLKMQRQTANPLISDKIYFEAVRTELFIAEALAKVFPTK